MLFRRLVNSIRQISARSLTSSGGNIVATIDNEGIALVQWRRNPVNSFSLEFIQEFTSALDGLNHEKCKGLIITSAIPKIFSAGIDLSELHKPDRERLSLFWICMQDLFLKLYGSEIPTTVMISGHTAAGGCVVSMFCDYRVMVSGSKIGMNDTAVGITPAWWICQVFKSVMGERQAEIAITSSKMYTAEEALKAQMIDELVTDREGGIEKCKQYIRQFDNISKNVQCGAKRLIRRSIIKHVEENREDDIKKMVDQILKPDVQTLIGNFVEQLKLRRTKK